MIIERARWAVYKNSFEAWEKIWAFIIESIAHLEQLAKKLHNSEFVVQISCWTVWLSATVYFSGRHKVSAFSSFTFQK